MFNVYQDIDIDGFCWNKRGNKMTDEIIEINEDDKVTKVEEIVDMDAIIEEEASDSEVKTEVKE